MCINCEDAATIPIHLPTPSPVGRRACGAWRPTRRLVPPTAAPPCTLTARAPLCVHPPSPSPPPLQEGLRRLAAYKAAGASHTYVMDLSATEVIDATTKGGPARFINHACQPNCETQKWQVCGGGGGGVQGWMVGWAVC
jgi:hypothetical protein